MLGTCMWWLVEQMAQTKDKGMEPDKSADFLGYLLMTADKNLDAIYGDHTHAKNGTHLDGGIVVDAVWQGRWERVF